MAVFKLFPEKDTTLYSQYPSMNTGLDQILEASTYIANSTSQVSRYLIQFSSEEISEVINNKINNSSSVVYLSNRMALIEGLNLEKKIYIHPVSTEWGMGTGVFGDSPLVTNGACWGWSNYFGGTEWLTGSYPTYTTGSYTGSIGGGGTWYTGSNLGFNVVHTQSFAYADDKDIKVDVSNTITTWNSYSLDNGNGFKNNGFIVKQQDSDEWVDSVNNTTYMRYFSIDTHTIYPPSLEFRWDDYSFNTGSSTKTILSSPSSYISIYNNQEDYYMDSIVKFRLASTPKNQIRTFSTASNYDINYYLPEDVSLYAIKDTMTDEYVVEFDELYTKISADGTSSYFTVYMNGLEPYRYYTILIKTQIDGNTQIFNENIRFKITK
jgi:hypothetical protein